MDIKEIHVGDLLVAMLKALDAQGIPAISNVLALQGSRVVIKTSGKELVSVGAGRTEAAGMDFSDKLAARDSKVTPEILSRYTVFLTAIKNGIVRLNHVGISYFCKDVTDETERLKDAVKSGVFNLYEEDSGNPKSKWLFIGNAEEWEDPLFEIVLNEDSTDKMTSWIPHFQIDLDTRLDIGILRKAAADILGKDFIAWEYDVPGYGIVLAMGILGEVNGVKIALSCGTNLRMTDYHRRTIKKISG